MKKKMKRCTAMTKANSTVLMQTANQSDSGSQKSYVTEVLQKKLDLRVEKTDR